MGQKVSIGSTTDNTGPMDSKNNSVSSRSASNQADEIQSLATPIKSASNLPTDELKIPNFERANASKMQEDTPSTSAADTKLSNSGSGDVAKKSIPDSQQSPKVNSDAVSSSNSNGNENKNGNGNENKNGNGNENKNGNGNENKNGNGNSNGGGNGNSNNNNGNGIGNRSLNSEDNTNANSGSSGDSVGNRSENSGLSRPTILDRVNRIQRGNSGITSESEIPPASSRTLTSTIPLTEATPEIRTNVNQNNGNTRAANPETARTLSTSTEPTQTTARPTRIFTRRTISTKTPVRTRVSTQPTLTFAPIIPSIQPSFPKEPVPSNPTSFSPTMNSNEQESRNNQGTDIFPSVQNNPEDVPRARVSVEPPPNDNQKLIAASASPVSSSPKMDPSTTATDENGISILPPTVGPEDSLNGDELNADDANKTPSRTVIIAASATASSVILLCGLSGFYILYKNKKKRSEMALDSLDAVSPVSLEQEVQTVFIPYNPELDDELQLSVGDKVIIQERFQDNWAIGSNLNTGSSGCFPLLCLDSDAASSIASEIGSIRSSYGDSKSQRTYSLYYSDSTATTTTDGYNRPY